MALPPGDWYTEPVRRNLLHSLRLKGVLYSGRTAFQQVQIIDTDPMGRTLVLDGKTQSAEEDEFIYHEALVHPAMLLHPDPKAVYIAGGGEGATLREALTHETVERAVMVDLDGELVDICKEHLPAWHRGAFDDPRAEVVIGEAAAYLEAQPRQFDVIIIDVTDPAEAGPSLPLFTRDFYRMALARLRPGGVLVTQAGPTSHGAARVFTAIAHTMAGEASIVFPYQAEVPSFGGNWGFVLASQGPSPLALTAEEIDGRMASRVRAEPRFYDGEAHRGMFALPRWLRREIAAEGHVIAPDHPVFAEG